jgi:peroxiredoxin
MGDRNGRWAMVFDKDGKVIYAENEKSPGEVSVRIHGFFDLTRIANVFQVSGADAVLSKL